MASMLEDLLKPASLPDRTKNVSLIQTHISMVIIADTYVYKIKKPVDFGFLDFSTLEKRRHFCHQEVELNKRLSEGLYLGVLPITYDGAHYSIGKGGGEVVDYAVKMKRIPDNRLMKSLFHQGKLKIGDLKDIARVLATFHQNASRSPEIDKFGERDAFKINTDENFAQTRKYVGKTIDPEDFDRLYHWTARFFEEKGRLFQDRIDQCKIRDCHGDLHMEHICLTDPIAIFDCIEFSDRLRYTDTFGDIAFLMMDLEFEGGTEFSKRLWHFYADLTGDKGMESLLNFYKVYRAYVRGKVNSFQLDDDHIETHEKDKATRTAKKYFKLALSYIS